MVGMAIVIVKFTGQSAVNPIVGEVENRDKIQGWFQCKGYIDDLVQDCSN